MSGSDIQILLDAMNAVGGRVERLGGIISEQGNRITALEVEVKGLVGGNIDASRLRWGGKEIFILVLMVIIPALAAYYGTKSQVESLAKGFEHHVEQARKIHPELDKWATNE